MEKKVVRNQVLSGDVVKRMFESNKNLGMTYEQFRELYRSTRHSHRNRFNTLEKPLSLEDARLVKDYLDKSVDNYAKLHGGNSGTDYGRVLRSAIKILHQYPESLKQALEDIQKSVADSNER